MGLYFNNKSYLEKALYSADNPPESTHTFGEALILCFCAARKGQLSNLCAELQKVWPDLSEEESYTLTRGISIPQKVEITEDVCRTIWNCAVHVLESGKPLGSEINPSSGRNTSHLWGHLIFESKAAGQLAEASGLDGDTARKLALLHDIGRTSAGTMEHGMRGFEILTDLGWDREALGCLTHSYLAGGRCTNLESAIPGFRVDEEGNSHFDDTTEIDDITIFLDKYTYTPYDNILNIADLMASNWAILPPAERVADVLTRRAFCPANHWFFKAELTNSLWEMREQISGGVEKAPAAKLKATAETSCDDIQSAFEKASDAFFRTYKRVCCELTVDVRE